MARQGSDAKCAKLPFKNSNKKFKIILLPGKQFSNFCLNLSLNFRLFTHNVIILVLIYCHQ